MTPMMTEERLIEMAKAKSMISNEIFKEMQDNLSADQIVLYISSMVDADVLGLLSGKSWLRAAGGTEEDLQKLLELEYLLEIKEKRSVYYVVADWWRHNSLPIVRLRKTTMETILDKLHVSDRIYNLAGDGVPARDWVMESSSEENPTTLDEKSPKTTTIKKEKDKASASNPYYEEVVTLWNASYPEKPAPKHRPGTKIYQDILSAIVYAGVDEAKLAASHAGAEMAIEPWFSFDTIFSSSDKINRLRCGAYDKAFGDTALKIEAAKREKVKEISDAEKKKELFGFE